MGTGKFELSYCKFHRESFEIYYALPETDIFTSTYMLIGLPFEKKFYLRKRKHYEIIYLHRGQEAAPLVSSERDESSRLLVENFGFLEIFQTKW